MRLATSQFSQKHDLFAFLVWVSRMSFYQINALACYVCSVWYEFVLSVFGKTTEGKEETAALYSSVSA